MSRILPQDHSSLSLTHTACHLVFTGHGSSTPRRKDKHHLLPEHHVRPSPSANQIKTCPLAGGGITGQWQRQIALFPSRRKRKKGGAFCLFFAKTISHVWRGGTASPTPQSSLDTDAWPITGGRAESSHTGMGYTKTTE